MSHADAARAQLAGNTAERNSGRPTRQPRLLTGVLFDANGNPMTPSHAVKKGTRYRYYVSRPLITKGQTESSAGLRIPASEIEQLVTSRVRQWLLDPGSIYQATRFSDASAQRAASTFEQAESDVLAVVDSQKTKAVIGTLTERYALRRYSEELDHRRREISGE